MKKPQFPSDGWKRLARSRSSSFRVDGGRPQMPQRLPYRSLLGLMAVLALLVIPGLAGAAKGKAKGGETAQPPVATSEGSLEQLPGRLGCLAQGKASIKLCGKARALKGAGPFMGSRAIAVSPDGKDVYVAAGKGNAIAIFGRNPETGALTQSKGKAGCVAAKAAEGCALAIGLIGPNSIAISGDGKNVYATSREGASLTTFLRNRKTGALRELPPSAAGCISGLPLPGCTAGRALTGPDVVVVSPDGKNVYVGDFFGNAVASFSRSRGSGALTQLGGTAGCIADATEGCAPGVELGSIEGLAVNRTGSAVYAAAAVSNAVDVLYRDRSTGALSQGTGTGGCIADAAVSGCALGYELAGANAVAVSPKGAGVYATSLFSNSVTTFHPVPGSIGLSQPPGPEREVEGEKVPAAEGTPSPNGCTVFLRAPGCAFGVALKAPEGLAVSPDGTSLYVAAYESGAIDVFDRERKGIVAQKPGERGCVAPAKVHGCTLGRALSGVSSVVVSPDGRNVYSTAENSNAVDIFRRIE
jgi:DNA-binding beta-propeller fold protein YncE